MFPSGKGVEKVKQLIEASMAVIKGNTVWKDAMKIEPITEDEVQNKPIYALTSIEWGAFRDTLAKRDKYWIYGPWREYAAFIFNGYKKTLTWDCSGVINYTPPCDGCSNCQVKRPEIKRWFFMPSTHTVQAQDKASFLNPECATTQELCFKTTDFKILTPNVDKLSSVPALNVILGKNSYSYTEFVSEGWNRVKGNFKEANVIPVRTLELLPKETDREITIEIDKEEFEVKPVRITYLPKVVKLFCKPEVNN